ncbi:hypothetical protein L1887_42443 [Cichorium endivia]|nr:hypothetical protein L1887_42443 [Cichorium endivia]
MRSLAQCHPPSFPTITLPRLCWVCFPLHKPSRPPQRAEPWRGPVRSASPKLAFGPRFSAPARKRSQPPHPAPPHGPSSPLRIRSRLCPLAGGHPRSSKALDEDLIFEKNVPIKLRDGVTILADIFRPVKQEKDLPAILVWVPVWKDGTWQVFDLGHRLARGRHLALRAFRARKVRGTGPCTVVPQKVMLSSTSIPGERTTVKASSHPCQAGPWYKTLRRRGVARRAALVQRQASPTTTVPQSPAEASRTPKFAASIFGLLCGRDRFELLTDELVQPGQDGLYREHARNISASPSLIKVPLYMTASVGSVIHLQGSILAWKKAASAEKWLRLHGGQEWWDLYHQQDDLERFFDRYLKGLDNGWEQTARVRYQLLPFGPLSSPKTLAYMTAGRLSSSRNEGDETVPCQRGSAFARAAGDGPRPSAMILAIRMRSRALYGRATAMWASLVFPASSCTAPNDTQEDFDIYITLRKFDKDGQPLFQYCWPLDDLQAVAKAQGKPIPASHEEYPALNTAVYVGPSGRIRASHRKVRSPRPGDEEDNLSWPGWPFHPHDERQPVRRAQLSGHQGRACEDDGGCVDVLQTLDQSGSSVFCWSVAVGRNGKAERELHGTWQDGADTGFGCASDVGLFGIRARWTAICMQHALAKVGTVPCCRWRGCAAAHMQLKGAAGCGLHDAQLLASRLEFALMTADRANKAVVLSPGKRYKWSA